MSAARNALLARPQWIISNSLTMPLLTFADNGKNSVRGLVSVVIPFTIFLDTLFSDKVNVFSTGRYLFSFKCCCFLIVFFPSFITKQ